jgi:hypothetical protein
MHLKPENIPGKLHFGQPFLGCIQGLMASISEYMNAYTKHIWGAALRANGLYYTQEIQIHVHNQNIPGGLLSGQPFLGCIQGLMASISEYMNTYTKHTWGAALRAHGLYYTHAILHKHTYMCTTKAYLGGCFQGHLSSVAYRYYLEINLAFAAAFEIQNFIRHVYWNFMRICVY